MVSIIIPVYNVEQYLIKCLDSCFNQRYTDIEVIAINDGSTDKSGQILDDYARKEPLLKVFHQVNSGVAVARGAGIAKAQGEWLMFLDSDDYLAPESVEILYTEAIGSCSDVCSGIICTETYNGRGEAFSNELTTSTKTGIATSLLTEKIQPSLCGKIFKSGLFNHVIIEERLKIGEDAFMVMQAFHYAASVSVVNQVVYYYYQRADSVMHRPSLPTLLSRLLFVELTIQFYTGQVSHPTEQLESAIHYFLMKELFAFLRMGGNYNQIPSGWRKRLADDCLKDKTALSLTPSWRKIMLRCYVFNPVAGALFRILFVKLRSWVSKH